MVLSNKPYPGIAFGGRKGNGKSLVAEHLCSIRHGVIMPSKTPIVEAFETWSGKRYVKARDDQDLIRFSTDIARVENPHLVANWLAESIPRSVEMGLLPVIPDMRFVDENNVLRGLGMLCIKIDATEETRQARTIARDGDLRNYDPLSATEREIDNLIYDEIIDNSREDGGAYAIAQLTAILKRTGL